MSCFLRIWPVVCISMPVFGYTRRKRFIDSHLSPFSVLHHSSCLKYCRTLCISHPQTPNDCCRLILPAYAAHSLSPNWTVAQDGTIFPEVDRHLTETYNQLGSRRMASQRIPDCVWNSMIPTEIKSG